MTEHIPNFGDPLTMNDLNDIFVAAGERNKKHRDEPMLVSMAFVMQGIGDRYTRVHCISEECNWTGTKLNVYINDGEASCPNGHDIVEVQRMTIGWVEGTQL